MTTHPVGKPIGAVGSTFILVRKKEGEEEEEED